MNASNGVQELQEQREHLLGSACGLGPEAGGDGQSRAGMGQLEINERINKASKAIEGKCRLNKQQSHPIQKAFFSNSLFDMPKPEYCKKARLTHQPLALCKLSFEAIEHRTRVGRFCTNVFFKECLKVAGAAGLPDLHSAAWDESPVGLRGWSLMLQHKELHHFHPSSISFTHHP